MNKQANEKSCRDCGLQPCELAHGRENRACESFQPFNHWQCSNCEKWFSQVETRPRYEEFGVLARLMLCEDCFMEQEADVQAECADNFPPGAKRRDYERAFVRERETSKNKWLKSANRLYAKTLREASEMLSKVSDRRDRWRERYEACGDHIADASKKVSEEAK